MLSKYSDNANVAAEHQGPAEMLSQLGDTSSPQCMGSKSVTTGRHLVS